MMGFVPIRLVLHYPSVIPCGILSLISMRFTVTAGALALLIAVACALDASRFPHKINVAAPNDNSWDYMLLVVEYAERLVGLGSSKQMGGFWLHWSRCA